jgi:hypothetical protein
MMSSKRKKKKKMRKKNTCEVAVTAKMEAQNEKWRLKTKKKKKIKHC